MPPVASCPDVAVLRLLLSGQVPQPDAGPLGEHLLQCDRCVKTIQGLSSDDTIVEDLRGGAGQLEPQLETFLRPRVERLKAERQGEVGRLTQKEKSKSLAPDEAKNLKHLRTYSIKIKGDGRLRYRYVAEAMDACTRAGFNNVGFAPPPGPD